MKHAEKHVFFGEQSIGNSTIGLIELARPQALNALTTEMLASIEEQLKTWQSDPQVVCVFLHSENPKAFCSGGDVKKLAEVKIHGDSKNQYQLPASSSEFFTQEYFTDYFVHQFQKPIVAWLDGICMGGGIGLTQGASHRIVTEKTVMAMPEVFIGFFPDVGGSRFLAALPEQIGLYLGLTGRKFSGATAVSIGLVDYLLPSQSKRQMLADITRLPWTCDPATNRELLSSYFKEKAQTSTNEFSSGEWLELKSIFARGDFAEIVSALKVEGRKPSLLSQAVFYKLYQENKNQTWEKVFQKEWSVALQFCLDQSGSNGLGEFGEGVRSLLIAKEPEAQWPKRTIAEALAEAERFLKPTDPNLLSLKMA